MPTNFELKRLTLKLDIAKKPENRVHELTDSNVSLVIILKKSLARRQHTVQGNNIVIIQEKRLFIRSYGQYGRKSYHPISS